jgi:membrane fusion protein, heavy metal efflux system
MSRLHLRMSAPLARAAALACILIVVGLVAMNPGRTHEGHDHADKSAADTGALASPRVAVASDAYQFVGIVEGEVLVVYLDRAASNEPVTAAGITVSLDGERFTAESLKNGSYEVTAPRLRRAGSIEVLVEIADAGQADLLAGALTIPPIGEPGAAAAPGPWSRVANLFTGGTSARSRDEGNSRLGVASFVAGLGLAVVAGLLGVRAWRRRSAAALLLGMTLCLAWTASGDAHEGHDHGVDIRASGGNTPQRRPDGTIFLPKPSQRLLEIRTAILQPQRVTRTVRLVGRVAANPNFSGVVQSTIPGRYEAPSGGVPPLGAQIKAGDYLGRITPAFASIDSSDMAQTLGDIEQKLSIARAKLARQEQLLRTNVAAPALVDETRMEVEGLVKRRTDLLAARVRAEDLHAPVAGVIAVSRAVSGQVVAQTDRLFEIVDPARVLVEALVFDQADSDAISEATAVVSGDAVVKLRLLGRSRALQQQYTLMQFEVVDSPVPLSVGLPVTVTARIGAPVSGLIVPRAALAQAPNGQTVVFEHKEPEVFVPRAVRTEPFDSQSVLVTGGVEAGVKVVVRNAQLVNQVR